MINFPGRCRALMSAGVTLLFVDCAGTALQAPQTVPALPSVLTASPIGETARWGSSHQNHSWLSPEAKNGKNHLYVLQQYGSSNTGAGVYIFNQKGQNQSPIGFLDLSNDPSVQLGGLAVDDSGTLYVGDTSGQGVWEIPKGKTKPKLILTGTDNPWFVTVGQDGTVYVANMGEGGYGNVGEYPKGDTKPSLTISFEGTPEGMALDANNNLYVAWTREYYPDNSFVYKFTPGSSTGTNLNLTIPLSPLGGIAIDKKDLLYVADPDVPAVLEYRLPATTILRSIGAPLGGPGGITLNAAQTRVWVTDYCCGGILNVYGFTAPGAKHYNKLSLPSVLSLGGIAADQAKN
jgi:hypothetical protein